MNDTVAYCQRSDREKPEHELNYGQCFRFCVRRRFSSRQFDSFRLFTEHSIVPVAERLSGFTLPAWCSLSAGDAWIDCASLNVVVEPKKYRKYRIGYNNRPKLLAGRPERCPSSEMVGDDEQRLRLLHSGNTSLNRVTPENARKARLDVKGWRQAEHSPTCLKSLAAVALIASLRGCNSGQRNQASVGNGNHRARLLKMRTIYCIPEYAPTHNTRPT